MIIGIDASRANRDHKSGTEWYSYHIIRWLAKIDPDNQYILYSDKPLTGGMADLGSGFAAKDTGSANDAVFDNNGFQVIKSPHGNFRGKVLNWPLRFFWTQGRLSIEMLVRRPDVLFVPSHVLPYLHPKKSVITIHDIGFERDRRLYRSASMGPEGRRSRKLLNFLVKIFTLGKYQANTIDYLRWSTEFALKHAHRVITVSDFSKREIEQFYRTDPGRISVIRNGYNRDLYTRQLDFGKTAEVLARYGIEAPYFFYVGRIERKKNTPALVESFAMMRERNKEIKHKLVLVGDAFYGYDEVTYVIEQFRLGDQVVMPGWVEEEDMPHFYAGADAFVFPSFYEGFGIPLLQAMAVGVPVAASWTTSIPEVVGDCALLFDPYNVRAISRAMERIITDKELRDRLKAKSEKHIAGFSWQKSAEETHKVLMEVGKKSR